MHPAEERRQRDRGLRYINWRLMLGACGTWAGSALLVQFVLPRYVEALRETAGTASALAEFLLGLPPWLLSYVPGSAIPALIGMNFAIRSQRARFVLNMLAMLVGAVAAALVAVAVFQTMAQSWTSLAR